MRREQRQTQMKALVIDGSYTQSCVRSHFLQQNWCFSRMRSEGFPFIVGVWGWTCVRFVLLPRRRLVVANSSRRRRQLVNSLPLGGTFALRHNPYLQSVKSGGSLARNARFGVVVVSSSCRRRVVVANSLIRCHWAVHSHCDTILTFKV